MTNAQALQWTVLAIALMSGLCSCALPPTDAMVPAVIREEAAGVPATGVPAAGAPAASPIRMVTLVEGLQDPRGLDFLPDGSLLVTEKRGTLKRIDPDATAVSIIAGVPAVADAGEGGLLDVLVHPRFARNEWVYLSYALADEQGYSIRVSRARLVDNTLVDLQVLFSARPFSSASDNFGGRLLLSGGYLYVTVGDRGEPDLAQGLDSHSGKVLRLTEDGVVPEDNPFVGVPGALPEIWSYGHGNPEGIALHPYTGQIWVTEQGSQGSDELNVLTGGGNYGWPLVSYGGGQSGEGTHHPDTLQPLVYWAPAIGTAGIAFYIGTRYPGWKPSLLVAGPVFRRISRLELEGEGVGAETSLLAGPALRIRDLQVGPDGLVYALAAGSRLIRLDVSLPADR